MYHAGMAVLTIRRGIHSVVMPAIQLSINSTRFLLPRDIGPRDIGTPSRSTGTLEPRDIGTPSAHGGKGHRPENRQRAPTQGTALSGSGIPLGSHRRSHRCAFHCQAAHGGYDVLGRCTLVASKVVGLSFPETLL